MELREYQVPKRQVPLPGPAKGGVKPSFEVRGLCVDDLSYLITAHLEPVTKALEMYHASRIDYANTGSVQQLVFSLIQNMPDLASEVISAASDATDDQTRAVARRLPIGTQMAALMEIVILTLEETGGLKNLLAEMRGRIAEATGLDASRLVSLGTARPEPLKQD